MELVPIKVPAWLLSKLVISEREILRSKVGGKVEGFCRSHLKGAHHSKDEGIGLQNPERSETFPTYVGDLKPSANYLDPALIN